MWRERRGQSIETDWIPAFAGMTKKSWSGDGKAPAMIHSSLAETTGTASPAKSVYSWRRSRFHSRGYSPLTFGIEGVIDDEFSREDVAIAESQRAEALGNPAQTFASRMGV